MLHICLSVLPSGRPSFSLLLSLCLNVALPASVCLFILLSGLLLGGCLCIYVVMFNRLYLLLLSPAFMCFFFSIIRSTSRSKHKCKKKTAKLFPKAERQEKCPKLINLYLTSSFKTFKWYKRGKYRQGKALPDPTTQKDERKDNLHKSCIRFFNRTEVSLSRTSGD